MKKILWLLAAAIFSSNIFATPTGDTSGKVTAVRTVNNTNKDYNSFQIWLTDVTNDRWDCIKDNGYIVVRDNTSSVNSESLKMMFSIALAAQTSGKMLNLDSSGTDPCGNVNQAWMTN